MTHSELKKLIKKILKESVTWQGWGDVTTEDREELKQILTKRIEYVTSVYTNSLSSSKVFLLKKIISGIDISDPTEATKTLSRLSMEDRMSLSDYIDDKGTDGARKAYDFLYWKCHKYAEGYKEPKYDIELKGITDITTPHSKSKGDVLISGLMDNHPKINFGWGSYALDVDFIKRFSKPGAKLSLDSGQNVDVVNMEDVMKQVKQSLEKWHSENN